MLEDELIAKIKRGDQIADIRRWFVSEIRNGHLNYVELTPFEQAFWNQMLFAFEAFRSQQRSLQMIDDDPLSLVSSPKKGSLNS